ncbi:hypothetical protein D3C81_954750 [compost metagenome]
MIQLHERPFLNPRHIAPRDAQLLGDLPLCPLFPAGVQAEAADHHLFFPVIQNARVAVNLALLDLEVHFLDNVIRIRAQNIDKRNLVALFIRPDRIVERHILAGLLKRTEMHEDLVLDAAGRETWCLFQGKSFQ